VHPPPDYLFVEVVPGSVECVFPSPLLRAAMEASFVGVIYHLASFVVACLLVVAYPVEEA
tara:strand:+ start:189 stop:368 length:180 start_codon:yes stop_codon:yes gene_type:complete